MAISLIKAIRQVLWPSSVNIDAFCLSAPSVTYKITAAASTDPFAAKANKYAESKVIRVTTLDKGCHIKFGDADITAATTSDAAIPIDTTEYFSIDESYPYIRIIEADATATITVTEVF